MNNEEAISTIAYELKEGRATNELVFETLDGFNPVLNSTLAQKNVEEANTFYGFMFDLVVSIKDTLVNLKDDLIGNKLQDEENRREMVEALSRLGEDRQSSPKPLPKKNTEPALLNLGGLSGFAILGAGVTVGTFVGFISEIFSFLGSTNKILGKLVYGPIKTFITAIKKFDRLVGNFVVSIVDKVLSAKFLETPIEILKQFSKLFRGLGKNIQMIFKPIISIFEIVSDVFKSIFSGFKAGAKLGKLFGVLAKKLFVPLTVVFAIWDTVKGAFAGFKENGIIGALQGGLTGLINGLVGSLLDLLKDGISWVAKKLGFENFANALDRFSFSKLFEDGIKAIFDTVIYFVDYIKDLFSLDKIKKAYEEFGLFGLFTLFTTNIWEMVKGAISWVATIFGQFEIANALDSLSIPNLIFGLLEKLKGFVTGVIDAIGNFFANPGDNIAGIAESITAWRDDLYKKILQSILPERTGDTSWTDPKHWVAKAIPDSIYEFAGMPTKAGSGLNDSTGGVNPFDKQAKAMAAGYASWDAYKESGWKWKGPSMQGSPSVAGQTLSDSASLPLQAPVIINNMGGNVTNMSTSNVNNNTTNMDPILTGSALGLSNF